MSNWNASNYRQKKAAQLALVKPEWVTNPETGQTFYLRKVSSLMSSVLAGYMGHGLTQTAVEAWKEKGVDGLEDAALSIAAGMSAEQRSEAVREQETTCRYVQQSCVIPLLSTLNPADIEFSDEWQADAIRGLTEEDADFDMSTFDPKTLVLHPMELAEKDANWLVKWAQGLVSAVAVKGGGAVRVSDLERFRKKAGRRKRTGTHG